MKKGSIFTVSVLFVSLSMAQLQAPDQLSPAAGTVGEYPNMVLTWKPSLGGSVSGYDVEISKDTMFTNPISPTVVGTSANSRNLEFGETYYWRVRGLSSSGNSPYASEGPITIFYDEFTGLGPTSSNTNPRVKLKWDTIPGVDLFQYEYAENTNFTGSVVGSITPDQSRIDSNSFYEVLVDQLKYGQRYYWRVRAMHAVDTSGWSDTISFQVRTSPTLQEPDSGAVGQHPETELICSGMPGSTQYTFQYDSSPLFDPSSNDLITVTVNHSDFSSNIFIATSKLDFGRTYYWRVRAINSNSTSSWSETFVFTTLNTVTQKSPDDSATVDPTTSLVWEEVMGSDGYRYQVDDDSDFSSPFIDKNISNDTAVFSVTEWTLDDYFWRVKAYHSRDSSDWSTTRAFNIHPTSVLEHDYLSEASVYPNPAIDVVYIDLPVEMDGAVRFSLFDITGQQIKNTGLNVKSQSRYQMNIADLNRGVYFLRIESGDDSVTRKIILQ